MRLYRLGPEGFFAVERPGEAARILYSDPYEEAPEDWRCGRKVDLSAAPLLVPVAPGKIVGVGRNYRDHAKELGHEVPTEPILFLKSPSSVVGPRAAIVLPPASRQVEYEGEIAVVLRATLRYASRRQAEAAVLGVTAACDVTARDLQRRDPTFARAKSFDTFCPLGPALAIEPRLDDLEVETRVNGERRQRGSSRDMIWDIGELLVYTSSMLTLEAGDVVLTGTPAGVGALVPGDRLEVEVTGAGVLECPVESWRPR